MRFSGGIALLLFIAALCRGENLAHDIHAWQEKTFPGVDSTQLKKVTISSTLRTSLENAGNGFFRDSAVTCYTLFVNHEQAGMGLSASVKSKSSVLRVVVWFDTSGSIVYLELPETPDPFSTRLQSPGWKKQFYGITSSDFGKIDALSGATVSSRDVTRTIKALLVVYHCLDTAVAP